MTIDKSQMKRWARKHFRGFENILLPSFTPDLKALDEEGIRHDVRHSIANGVFSVFAVGMWLSPQELRRYFEIVVDEAGGRIAVGSPLIEPNREAVHGVLRAAKEAGLTHVLAHPFHDFHATSEDELFEFYRDIIENTDLAVAVWATDGPQFMNLHPSGVSVNVLDRVADYANVVAIKLMTTLDLPVVYEICERLHERVLIGGVHLGMLPFLSRHYGTQWSGAWTIEALQTPKQPLVNDYLNLLLEGRTQDAMTVYWKIKPGYDALYGLMAPMLPMGVHPFTHLKYYQWCSGGNGGLLREPMDPNEHRFPLRPEERDNIRSSYSLIGIEPTTDSDECFVVGRAAYTRGARAADMPVKPTYIE